ncbi:hypothetical protein BOTBODRAFT_78981, partial [Botryobasidium botryosum FD-172 SS1]
YAAQASIDIMTFDSLDELIGSKPPKLSKMGYFFPDALTDDSRSVLRLSTKFGVLLTRILQLLFKAIEPKFGVNGPRFHVGGGCYDPHACADVVRRAIGL